MHGVMQVLLLPPFLYLTLDTLFCLLFADFLFYAAFQVFSLWAAPRTRDKFMFVNSGWGSKPLSHLLALYPSGHICTEVGLGARHWRH